MHFWRVYIFSLMLMMMEFVIQRGRAEMKLAYSVVEPPGDVERNLPPVICLHGMMDSRKTWNKLAEKIASLTGRKVYTLDLRNHGESGWSDAFNFDILAEDVDEFMGEHNISKAALVGHSMGGKTAMTLALRKPERVEKLVVEDMMPRNFKIRSGTIILQLLLLLKEAVHSIPKDADEQSARKAVVDFMMNLLPPGHIALQRVRNFEVENVPIKKTEDGFDWQANFDVLEEVLTHPEKLHQQLSGAYMGDALFLYGTKSFFKVANDDLIHKLFPKAQMRPVEEAGHLIHHEYPQRFLTEVVKFINNSHPTLKSKV